MQINKLILHNFRNYESAQINFCQNVNLIQGDNAQGKTNILEALSLLSTGKSFRTPRLEDAIRKGSSCFFIEAYFEKEGVEQTLSLAFDGQNKKIQHNATTYNSFTPLLGILQCVFIVPEDISLIIGPPSDRRRFIDIHLAQMDPLYVYHLGRYHRAMKQRNALLKMQSEEAISNFEHIMAQASAYIVTSRKRHIKELAPLCQHYMHILSENKESIEMKYHSSLPEIDSEKDLSALYFLHFNKTRKKEMIIKNTLSGPHRDEMHLFINEKEAKFFGSEGQKRCFLTALILSQRDLFRKNLHSYPAISIDDFGTHLDKKRSDILLDLISNTGQIFLSSPTDRAFSSSLQHKRFSIKNGRVDRLC